MTIKNLEAEREEESKAESEESKKQEPMVNTQGYCSSGLESDNDLDLLVE